MLASFLHVPTFAAKTFCNDLSDDFETVGSGDLTIEIFAFKKASLSTLSFCGFCGDACGVFKHPISQNGAVLKRNLIRYKSMQMNVAGALVYMQDLSWVLEIFLLGTASIFVFHF